MSRRVGLCFAIAAGIVWSGAVAQQGKDDSIPNKGVITYQGTYGGEVVTQHGRRTKAAEMSGALTIQASFDGPSVTATLKPTGTMRDAKISGSRTGSNCKLFYRNGDIFEGECSRSSFKGVIRSQDGARRQADIEFSTLAIKVVDDDERRRAAAEEQARREADQAEAAIARKKADEAEKAKQEEILRSLPPAGAKK